uniref:Uncharacterized protein n=1 Tax=Oryza punctata TaxID=4537 RepID=A0A0E0M067_ORYPU
MVEAADALLRLPVISLGGSGGVVFIRGGDGGSGGNGSTNLAGLAVRVELRSPVQPWLAGLQPELLRFNVEFRGNFFIESGDAYPKNLRLSRQPLFVSFLWRQTKGFIGLSSGVHIKRGSRM